MNKIKIIFGLLLLMVSLSLSSQSVYTVNMKFNIETDGKISEMKIEGVLPSTILNRQRVIRISPLSEDIEIYTKDGNTYFLIHPKKHILEFYEIEYVIEIFHHDLKFYQNAKAHIDYNKDPDVSKYLKGRTVQQIKSKRLKEIAENIEGENQVEVVKNIYEFVIDHLDYQKTPGNHIIRALKALKKGKGDCTEYSDLMATLCRIKGIPARVIGGLTTSSGSNPNHNWCEVYLEEFGWVPFDPTFGENPNLFDYSLMANCYIYLYRQRYDEILGESMWKYYYKRGKGNSYNIGGESSASLKVKPSYKCKRSSVLLFDLAVQYYDLEKYDEALAILDDLMLHGPKNTSYLTLKANIIAKNNDVELAKQIFQLAISYSKHHQQKMKTYFEFGRFLSLVGDYKTSFKFLKRSFEFGSLKIELVKTNEDFAPFRESEHYQALLASLNISN